ncbi:DNA-3-methyladenine glycosylase [Acidithrix sp. C25]|uniref:DNA-3-methyladenine glycosylase n=1 Tax=Acidithrix sp. C25 TaxID=1671482 RepID=UPI00191B90F6|nr:DNA-3-methyladenine glycosylase [Acidithrix sp. C25]CAG4930910.1 unnamed protein product [Acidithrix sp. C25]
MNEIYSLRQICDEEFFQRDTLEVAKSLIGMVILYRGRAIRVSEVEAYRGKDDPASHGFGGISPRNKTMFGPPGHIYVYLSYGIHHCLNIVAETAGSPSGILVRAGEPLEYDKAGSKVRVIGPSKEREPLSSVGPGRLGRYLNVKLSDDGINICRNDQGISLFAVLEAASKVIKATPRIGITKGTELEWRFVDSDSTYLSKGR